MNTMPRNLSFLIDVKGDMCRIGYMKIISHILAPNKTLPPEPLSERLETLSVDNSNPRWENLMEQEELQNGLSKTMMIPKGTAKSYVEFAELLKIYSSFDHSLISNGIVLSNLLNLGLNTDFFQTHTNPLVLTNLEKIFFWNIFLEEDSAPLFILMNYIITKNNICTRSELMGCLMETPDGYKNFLQGMIDNPDTDWDSRTKAVSRLQTVDDFAQNRQDSQDKGEWNLTEQYALYRHFADPRIQWLVDLGFLKKEGRSGFRLTLVANDIFTIFSNYKNDENYNPFIELCQLFIENPRPVSDEEIKEQILNSYDGLTKGGTSTTKKSLLYSAVVYSLLNSGSIIGHEKVITLVDKLQQEHPNCIYESVDYDGNPTFIHITTDEFREEYGL